MPYVGGYDVDGSLKEFDFLEVKGQGSRCAFCIGLFWWAHSDVVSMQNTFRAIHEYKLMNYFLAKIRNVC